MALFIVTAVKTSNPTYSYTMLFLKRQINLQDSCPCPRRKAGSVQNKMFSTVLPNIYSAVSHKAYSLISVAAAWQILPLYSQAINK
jgi:hypothetical protein